MEAEEDEDRDATSPYKPIRILGEAGYGFNVPPGLRYLETQQVIFRVDPTKSALELKAVLESKVRSDPALRGPVEATTGPWTRCMTAELEETTREPILRAVPVEKPKLKIRPLSRDFDDRGEEIWVDAKMGDSFVHRMGLHPTDWRWSITGIRPGRTQLVLRVYAVAVLADSPPGRPRCGERLDGDPDSTDRVRTLQRRIAIEVSAAEWVDVRLPSPWLWSLLLPFLALGRAWWRRRRGRPVLAPGEDAQGPGSAAGPASGTTAPW